jgi:hypothetical protein
MSEHDEQVAYFQWVRLMANSDARYFNIFAIPNGAYLGSDKTSRAITMSRLKAEGFEPGVPDIFIAWCSTRLLNNGMFIEMKVKPNKPTNIQEKWHRRLERAGYAVKTCYGFDEAKKETEEYMRGEK